jgi:hypothetical protein
MKVHLDLLAPPAPKVPQVQPDPQDWQAQMVLRVQRDLPAQREPMVHTDLPAPQGLKVQLGLQDRWDPQDQQAQMVLRVLLDHRGRRGQRVLTEHRELRDPSD